MQEVHGSPTRRASPIPVRPALLLDSPQHVAGAVGIEPTNAGIKIRCLTTWRLPRNLPDPSIAFIPPNRTADAVAGLPPRTPASIRAPAATPPARWPRTRTDRKHRHQTR